MPIGVFQEVIIVLYSFHENPSKLRPFASDNWSANLVLCLLVSICSQKIQEEYEKLQCFLAKNCSSFHGFRQRPRVILVKDMERTRNHYMKYTKGGNNVKTGKITVAFLCASSNDALYLYKVS